MKRVALIISFAAIALTAGCVSQKGVSAEIGSPLSAPAEQAIMFEPQGAPPVAAFAGSFFAPENRADPASRRIEIHYVRFAATGEKPGAPIVYLSGGPGGSGIDTAKGRRFPLFMAMREFGDVIALDQRGTGASNNLPTCKSGVVIPETKRVSDTDYTAYHRQSVLECAQFWREAGVDIEGYTTLESARDLDALRKHLGEDRVTLWGISYGSHLAFAAMKEMGDRIDRVVIASAEGLDQTVKLPARTDAYFDRLQTAINTQPKAAAIYPDIKGLLRRVHDKLDAEPVLLNVPQQDGTIAEMLLQRHFMQSLASAMIADPESAAQMLGVYAMVDQGVYEPLIGIIQRYFVLNEPISWRPMSLAMDVASGIDPQRLAQVEAEARTSLLGAYLNFPMPQLHDVLPDIVLDAEFRQAPVSDIPTLLLSGTLDGRTYPQSQREATVGLSRLRAVTVVNAGHNLFMASPEVRLEIQKFMRGEASARTEINASLPDMAPF
jgi:pimeloyl-ACP methyl ester carboxylesterase